MLCDSVRLGEYAAFRLGRGQQWGSVNDEFNFVFLYFLLFSCFLLLVLMAQCLNGDLSLVKRLYEQVVSRHREVQFVQTNTIQDKDGRFIIVQGHLFNLPVVLACVYAPNWDNAKFFTDFFSLLPELNSHQLVLGEI